MKKSNKLRAAAALLCALIALSLAGCSAGEHVPEPESEHTPEPTFAMTPEPTPEAVTPAPAPSPEPTPALTPAPTPRPEDMAELINAVWPKEAAGIPVTVTSPIAVFDVSVPQGTSGLLYLECDGVRGGISHTEVSQIADRRELVTLSCAISSTSKTVTLFYGEGENPQTVGIFAVPTNIPVAKTASVYGETLHYISDDGGDIRHCGPLDELPFPSLPAWMTVQSVLRVENIRGGVSVAAVAVAPDSAEARVFVNTLLGITRMVETEGHLTGQTQVGRLTLQADFYSGQALEGVNGFAPALKPDVKSCVLSVMLLAPDYDTEVRADDDPEMKIGSSSARVERVKLYHGLSPETPAASPAQGNVLVEMQVSTQKAGLLENVRQTLALSDGAAKYPVKEQTEDKLYFEVPFDAFADTLVWQGGECQIPLP